MSIRNDLFAGLLSYQWRGIEFPCESFEVEVTQDHVEHKYPDKDGAHIEGVGKNPRVFTAKALFLNSIKPGPSESQFGVLYPNQFRLFLKACEDRTTGNLQHPELGFLFVKCKSARTHWDSRTRDGVKVDVTWVETLTDQLELQTDQSPISNAYAIAVDLDVAINKYPWLVAPPGVPQPTASLDPIVRPLPGLPPKSFADMMNSITAIVDSASLFNKQIAGKINEIGYRLTALSAAVDRAKDVQTWPIRQNIEKLRDALNKQKQKLLVNQKSISVFIVPRDMSLAAICATLGVDIGDLMRMNVGKFDSCIVKARTQLRYYSQQSQAIQATQRQRSG